METTIAIPEISLSTERFVHKVPHSETFRRTEANTERFQNIPTQSDVLAEKHAGCHNSDEMSALKTEDVIVCCLARGIAQIRTVVTDN
jgi:hypothetical protein